MKCLYPGIQNVKNIAVAILYYDAKVREFHLPSNIPISLKFKMIGNGVPYLLGTRPEIINMFRRLNLTDYNLNSQEKRNSLSGEFASLARQLSDLPIWEKYKLFNNVDVKRMKDVEFCASLILLFRSGIIDQSDQKALNRAYEDLQVKYDDANNDRDAIIHHFDFDDVLHHSFQTNTQLLTLQ